MALTYQEALAFIHSRRHGGPDLNRMRIVLDRLGAPDRRVPFVHVAGTNGKGSVCAFIASVLEKSGLKTGLFTSPFVRRFNERIRVDGMDIPDNALAEVTARVRAALGEFEAQVAEFELVTLIGLTYFAQESCAIAVLEVGMGGVHDATNVIEKSEVSVFTAIGLDHTQYLGNTVEEIAAVKAGIIKPHGTAVSAGDPGGVLSARCRALDAAFTPVELASLRVRARSPEGVTFDFDGLEGLEIPLAGSYQPANAALAITALRALRKRGWNVPDAAIRAGLRAVSWPGRFELLRRGPDFILDGGHNPPAVEATVKSLADLWPGKRAAFVLGVMADKDVAGILERLLPVAERFYCVAPPAPRALAAEKLAAMIAQRGGRAEAMPSVAAAVGKALAETPPEGIVCALGSLYILEEARQALARLTGV